jgi:hypothetical protein
VGGNEAREFLETARGLIAESWAQGAEARTVEGSPTDPWSPDAVSWSLLGALVAVYERLTSSIGQAEALHALARACVLLADTLDCDSLADWNDARGRTQADVLAAVDEAAERDEPALHPPQKLN